MKASSPYSELFPVVSALVVGALLSFEAPSSAQTFTVVTEPVGFTKTTIPGASEGETVRRVLAVPYQRPGVFQSTVSAVSSNTLTLAQASWGTGEFLGSPHFVAIRKGGQAGRFFRITAHTTSVLTLDSGNMDLSTLVASGDSAEIFPANTLGSLFGTGSVPFKTGPDANSADLIRLLTASGWISYFHDGTSWRTPGNGGIQNAVVLPPDRGFLVIARGTNPLTLQLNGEINMTRQRSSVPGSGEALVANRFPTATTLGALQIQTLTGWTSGDAASVADNVLIWNGKAWDIYYYNAGNWEQVGSFSNANNTPIPVAGAVMIHRKQGANGSEQQLPADPPFTSQ